MTRDEVNDLLLGVAVIALGYALYKHFKPAAKSKATATPSAPDPATSAQAQFNSMKDLFAGTVFDIYNVGGNNQWWSQP